ncbi:secretory component protein SHR3 [Xylona heveae TC161]|uniref:Secretory component protein SHR3 n=1 Tax=Xylona heveae (strain CBS 132557 / TC161) TaxID=1328760 RepID=A0A161TFI3_XYLHT|nr:secretory component protein SHR3 [Xylona heveae TC161]KZF24797.1 secretory component protein SHR3 [Xylona heveae TC161]
MAKGTGSFATFLILCPTAFFLGLIFASFPYDYPVLWTSLPTPDSYYDMLEAHLRFVHASPPIIPRILHIVIAVGLLGFIAKLYRPSEANLLFDGASLVLYMVALVVYITNIVKGLRIVTDGTYGQADLPTGSDPTAATATDGDIIGREDSLRVIAASNTIMALVLVGVLVLQAGQWYALRKEGEEIEQINAAEREHAKNGSKTSASTKKKQ